MINHLDRIHHIAAYDAAVAHLAHYIGLSQSIDWKQFKSDVMAQLAALPPMGVSTAGKIEQEVVNG